VEEDEGPPQYRLLKTVTLRKHFKMNSKKFGELMKGDTIEILEKKKDKKSGERQSRCDQGWFSMKDKTGKKVLVEAEKEGGVTAVKAVDPSTMLDIRNLLYFCPVRLSETDCSQALAELETEDFVQLDTFAKWFSSKKIHASGLNTKVKNATIGLGWPEMASLEVYINPDEEQDVIEAKAKRLKQGAKGAFVLSTLGVRALRHYPTVLYLVHSPGFSCASLPA
jgi:hypothetical protein